MSEITVTIIEQTIDIPTRVGIDGDDAFELWLKIPGNEDKTFQDWLNWVRQPATDAATEIGELEDEVRVAELDRRDQEIIRGNNENIRKQNEIDRGLAEGDREIVKQEMIDERLISEELNDHPPVLIEVSGRQLWHYWDLASHSYISTGLPGAFNFVPNDLVSYQKYDVVQVNGTSYISLIDNNTSPIQEGTNWKTIAKVGRTPQFEIGEVTTTEEGTQATVTITLTGYDTDQNPQYTVDYSIPRGYSGVYVGEDEPTDPTVVIWLDLDEGENFVTSSEFGISQSVGATQNLTTRAAAFLNIDKLFSLSSGYYTAITARTAVPVAVRANGLVISYQTESGWITERFEGSIIDWLNGSNWHTITPSKKYVDDGLATKENVSNKKSTINESDTEFPTSKAVFDGLGLKLDKLATANNLTTTEEGLVLDARQGKALDDSKLDKSSVKNELGDSEELVMSQKGVKEKVKLPVESGEQAAAAALVELKKEVAYLKEVLSNVITYLQINTLSVDSLQIKGAPLFIFSDVVPTIVPDFAGQIYIKTTATAAAWIALGDSSVANWKEV